MTAIHYAPTGNAASSGLTVQRLDAEARSQIGYREGHDSSGWDNVEKYAAEINMEWVSAGHYPWCAIFFCWIPIHLKVHVLPAISASCGVMMNAWKRAGRWSEYPAVGAEIIYGNGEHTGWVTAYDATTVWTVEGNTNTDGSAEGNGVYLKAHRRNDPWITGYGLPNYAEGIVSADPKYRPKTVVRKVVKVAIKKAIARPGKRVYVKAGRGQSLSLIAAQHRLSLAALEHLNPQIHNPNLIQVGQSIRVK